MANGRPMSGLASALQRVAQGGQMPSQTLAHEIGASRHAAVVAAQERQRDLMEMLSEHQGRQSEMRRRAVQNQADIDEMRRHAAQRRDRLLFGFLQGAVAHSDDPESLRGYLASRPRAAQTLGINPANPDVDQIEALRDRFEVQVTGQPLDATTAKEEPRSMIVRPGTELGQAVGLEPGDEPQEVEYIGGELTPANLRDGTTQIVGYQGIRTPSQTIPPYRGGVGEEMAGIHTEAMRQGAAAQPQIQGFNQLETALLSVERGGFRTGFLGELRQLVSQAAELFGIDADTELFTGGQILGTASASEVVDSISSKLGIDMAEALTRPTNMQVRMIRRAIPNLSKTIQGNLILTRALQLEAERRRDIGQIAQAFTTHGDPETGTVLVRPVTVAGLRLEEGTSWQEAIAEYDKNVSKFHEDILNYIHNAAKYQEAKVAPHDPRTGKLDETLFRKGEIYLMPDSRVIRYQGPDEKPELIDDLNEQR